VLPIYFCSTGEIASVTISRRTPVGKQTVESIDRSTLYATIGRRLKASVIDGVVVTASIVVIPLAIHALFGANKMPLMGLLMYAPLLALEPVLVSFWGQTVGQYVLGIKVIREKDSAKCPLPQSFCRFYVKAIFGIWSMIYMVFSQRHKAIHDYLAGTLVILSPARLRADPSFADRGEGEQEGDAKFVYPSVRRRFVYFLVWYFAILFGVDLLLKIILRIIAGSDRADRLFQAGDTVIEVFGWILLIVVASLAAKGRLPGAKRTRKFPEGYR
jgi:uncharacterized RDD family membrane protein YckC